MEAVRLLDLSTAHVNHRGAGSDQYPPGMMPLANASKHCAASHGHALKQMVLLDEQFAELLEGGCTRTAGRWRMG